MGKTAPSAFTDFRSGPRTWTASLQLNSPPQTSVPSQTPRGPRSKPRFPMYEPASRARLSLPLLAMQEVGDALVAQSTLPAGSDIQVLVEPSAARVTFVARQVHPYRAGAIAVTQEAADEDGPDAVIDAFSELVGLMERHGLPEWPPVLKAPVLLVRTPLGWGVGTDARLVSLAPESEAHETFVRFQL